MQLGGVLDEIRAQLLPEDKASVIKELQKEGPTAMIGDGLNDAPALATADIGISMGVSGSALATESGDIVLMSNDIQRIPKAFRIAKQVRRKIIENVVISITTKAAIVGLAIAGHPLVWAAVLADVGTCLLVIFNSMLLLKGTGQKCCPSNKCGSSGISKTGSSCGSHKCSDSGGAHDHNSHSHKHEKHSSDCEEEHGHEGHHHHHHPHSEKKEKDHKCCGENNHSSGPKRSERCDKTTNCEHHKEATPEKNHEHDDHRETTLDSHKGKCCEKSLRKHQHSSKHCNSGDTLGSKKSTECKASKKAHRGCCESYRRECCIRNGKFDNNFRGGLSEIVIE